MDGAVTVKTAAGEVCINLSAATHARITRAHDYLRREWEVHYVALELKETEVKLTDGAWGPQLLVFRDSLALRVNDAAGKQSEVALRGV